MTFIGYIAEKKDENIFKRVIKSFLDNTDIKAMIVTINENSIKNIKNIRFDTIIIDRNIKRQFEGDLKEILKIAKYLLINSDKANIGKFQKLNLTVITYGFGNKCTVTASSVEKDNTLICLQRAIKNFKNDKIEPQEVSVNINETTENNYLSMIIGMIQMLY